VKKEKITLFTLLDNEMKTCQDKKSENRKNYGFHFGWSKNVPRLSRGRSLFGIVSLSEYFISPV